jgi:hypothetical protein
MKPRHTFAVGDPITWFDGRCYCYGLVESLTDAGFPRVDGTARRKAAPARPAEWAEHVASRDARLAVVALRQRLLEAAMGAEVSASGRAAVADVLRAALAELERIEQARAEVTP